MSELPILEGVLKYVRENNISLSMPGHKGGKGFYNTSIGREFIDNILKLDITEVDGVDNLHNPEGIILEASKRLSEFYGSEKSYFLVNGSTSGNMIMIFSSFNEGDKILVERNCHRSILNAIIMRKLRPVYIESNISKRLNAPISINLEHFLQVLKENIDAKGIIVTYPNYYGICSNLGFIIDEAKKHNMKVLVDSAHGSHFGVYDELPESAVKLGADMVVTSSHKTLSSLTQTAYLHVNNGQDIEKVDFYFSAFLSTSPSYLFLCSMDYSRFYLEKYGFNEYKNLLKVMKVYRDKINKIKGLRVIGKNDIEELNRENHNYVIDKKSHIPNLNKAWNIDLSRYIINLDQGYSGYLLLEYLRKMGIQAEMGDSSNVVLIFSPFNNEDDFEKLYQALKSCDLEQLKCKEIPIIQYKIPRMEMIPFEVINKKKEFVDLSNSIGRISATNIVPYPPGVPILSMGELIDIEVLETINYYKDSKVDLLGISNSKIEVIK